MKQACAFQSERNFGQSDGGKSIGFHGSYQHDAPHMLKSRIFAPSVGVGDGIGKHNMHPDTNLVIQVQSLDQKITALEKEVAALPKHIAVIEKTLESHLKEARGRQSRFGWQSKRTQGQGSGDPDALEQKISKLKDQMLGAKNTEQYRAFQNEIDFAAKEIRKAEDRILELMTESEPPGRQREEGPKSR